ncbi:MAG TPA: glycine cleavage system aminomethyltransferase GcvT [Acidobacteriaceae bacterium]|jgi:aminomethyltransferase|nr:glycine cleavage system aminomethyltransferase GcvT [Acidobacteriaceae bacterium]
MSAATPSATVPALRKTALHATHRQLGAKMVDFGGWDMPVEYSGLIAEHMAVRTRVGLFDVSHMGEIQLRGPEALEAVQYFSMNDAARLAEGQAQYSALLTPQGTFIDDILVHKLGANDYLLVVNAGTCDTDYAWVREQSKRFHCHVSNYSSYYSQLAIQGPQALAVLRKLTAVDLEKIKNYWFVWGTVCGVPNVLISRTGYTGEDGFEIYIPADEATSQRVWNEVLEAGREFEILPCGLGARNTLRLEAGMPLYGHEIDDQTNVLEAGLDRFCKLDKPDFIGKQALVGIRDGGGPKRKLVGLEMLERGIGRDGYRVLNAAAQEIGKVTSGSPAPFLKKNIAMGYVPPEYSAVDTELAVEVRNQPVKAKVVSLPFYRRPKKQT